MKKLLIPLTILICQSAFADDASTLLKKQILEGKNWVGVYTAEYYPAVKNAAGKDEFFFKSVEESPFIDGPLDMTLDFSVTANGLTYEWDREIRDAGETDDKTCASKEITVTKKGKTKKVTVGKALPRVLVLKQDLLDLVDVKAPAAVVPDVHKAEKAKIEGLFAGIQQKLQLRDPVIALIKGKRCSETVIGEDLNVPVLKIEMSADGKEMSIIASIGMAEGYPAMGFTTYKLKAK